MAKAVLKTQNISIRLICEIFGISKTTFHYQGKTNSENRLIETWLLKLTETHKRVLRIYRELELNLRIRPRKRIIRNRPEALGLATDY